MDGQPLPPVLPGLHAAHCPPTTHILGRLEKPILRCLRVRDGLLGGKSLQPESTTVGPKLRAYAVLNQGSAAEAVWVPRCHKEQCMTSYNVYPHAHKATMTGCVRLKGAWK